MKVLNLRMYYQVFPRIVKTNTTATITISPKYNMGYFRGDYVVVVWPLHQFDLSQKYQEVEHVVKSEKELVFQYDFQAEQEYVIQVFQRHGVDDSRKLLIEASVYALGEDLYGKKPYKGDLHTHTNISDGVDSPAHLLAASRGYGLDFIAITDHSIHFAQNDVDALMSQFPNNMVVFRGEEAGTPRCPIHFLSLDADRSIGPEIYLDVSGDNTDDQILHELLKKVKGRFVDARKWFGASADANDAELIEIIRQKSARLEERISKVRERCGEEVADVVNKEGYYAAVDAFEQIREAGGFGSLSHSLRLAFKSDLKKRNDVPLDIVHALLKNKRCDAFELCSGVSHQYPSINNLQEKLLSLHHPDAANMPVIGVTDSHKSLRNDNSSLGNIFTVAFVDDFSVKGIRQGILEGYSIAVENFHYEKSHRCHGSFRLSQYGDFLIREYFPEHDKCVGIEGELMRQILSGDTQASHVLEQLCDKNNYVFDREWWGHLS